LMILHVFSNIFRCVRTFKVCIQLLSPTKCLW
jgi:hypothetical protein